MANILDYVADDTYAGQLVEVKAKKFVWVKVGQGTVAEISEHLVDVQGKISILGYSGDLNIWLKLTDEDLAAREGACVLRLNTFTDDNAMYKAANGTLKVNAVLGDAKMSISITKCNNGEQTECKLTGYLNETVHLDPKN